MIQEELDKFEQKVLTDLFGGYTHDKFVVNFGIFKYDFSDKIQNVIVNFENFIKPLILSDGSIQLSELQKYIDVKYIQFSDKRVKFSDVYYYIKPLLQNLKGLL